MKKINNGFSSDLWLTEQGLVYNKKTDHYLKPYKDHCYKLKDYCNKTKTISLKSLYKMVYGNIYCIDKIPNLDNQIWKVIQNTNEQYYISNFARVKSYKGYEAKLLKPYQNKKNNGYLVIKLNIDNQYRNISLHRLVAAVFLQNPKQEVHHLDFDRYNNVAANLKWVTKEEHRKIHEEHNKEE